MTANNRWRGPSQSVVSPRVREYSVRLRLQSGAAGRPLDFPVRWQAVAYERVHTVANYFDGPREGLADYQGSPHRYKNEWDEAADDWADPFEL
jgi:hypothetical protein